MKTLVAGAFLAGVVLALVVPAAPAEGAQPFTSLNAADRSASYAADDQEPPPPPPGPPPRAPEPRPGEGWRPGPGGPPPGEAPPGREGRFGAWPPPPPPEPLLRLIAERRPDLAERLERLRQMSPDQFREVLADALAARLEEVLNDAERSAGPGTQPERGPGGLPGRFGPRGRGEPGAPGWPPGPASRPGPPPRPGRGPENLPPEARARIEELETRQQELETRSRELADRLRESPQMSPEARAGERAALTQLLSEQFNVRTELRGIELTHLEHELARLRERLEQVRHELEERERQRSVIIERRVDQLLGAEASGW